MTVYIGIDWSEAQQDWALVDQEGDRLRHGRFPLTLDGFTGFVAAVEPWRDPATGYLPPVCIETGRGVLVSNLLAAGFPVHAVNPLKVKRFREVADLSGGKNDKADARLLAEVLRVNMRRHPALPGLSDAAMSLAQVTRAHQDTLWRTLNLTNELRSLLFESWPAANSVFKPSMLVKPEVLAVLRAWPTPGAARGMTKDALREVLVSAGRSRYLDRDVDAWHAGLTAPGLAMPDGVMDAYGEHTRALLDMLDPSAAVERRLRDQVLARLVEHPLNALVESVPCLGGVTAARVIAELGDDPTRFRSAQNARAFAGTAPVHKSSSSTSSDKRRHIKNNRLNHAVFLWAFAGLRYNPGIRAGYDYRRTGVTSQGRHLSDKHPAALRNVGNRLVGCLWHCIATGELWDDRKVWAARLPADPDALPAPPADDPAERPEDSPEPEFTAHLDGELAVAALL